MFEKVKNMRKIVLDELKHIPKAAFPQGFLRAYYWDMRMNSLSDKTENKKTPKEILKDGIDYLRKDYPDYDFKYDKEFFSKF